MAELNIMSVREMIDKSFGHPKTNTVNLKLIQAVLIILAKHLRVLTRHVHVETIKRSKPEASLSVTELKIHSKSKKKRKSSDTKSQKYDSSHDRKKSTQLKSGIQVEKDAATPHGKTTPSKKTSDEFTEQPGKTTSSKKTTDEFTEQPGKHTSSKKTTDEFTEQPGKTTSSKKTTDEFTEQPGKHTSSKKTSDEFTEQPGKTTSSKKTTDEFAEQPGKTTSSKKTTDEFAEQPGKHTSSKKTTDEFTEQPGKTTPSKKTTDEFTEQPGKHTSSKKKTDEFTEQSGTTTSSKKTTDEFTEQPGKHTSSKKTTDEFTEQPGKTTSSKKTTDEFTEQSGKTTPSKTTTDEFTEQPGKTTPSKKTTDEFTEQPGKHTSSKKTTDEFTEQPGKTTPSKKTTGQEQTSTDKDSTQMSAVQKGAAETAPVKTSPEKSSTDKSSRDKSSRDKSSTNKYSTENSSTQKASTTAKSLTGKSTSDKSLTGKSSTEKSSTAISSTYKTSAEKSSTEKSSTEKSSTEKFSSDKSSTDKSSSEKSTTDKSVRGRSSTEKFDESSSSQDTDTRTKTTALQKVSKSLTEFATDKNKNAKAKTGKKGEGSDEDEDEILHEKLLIVSRTSSSIDAGAEQSAVATQEQYKAIVSTIRQLQARYNQEDTLLQGVGTDKQTDIRIGLQKRTSMTDPMAALNMSARLEAAEKRLSEIMPIATDLAEQIPGIDLESAFDDTILNQRDIGEWGPPGLLSAKDKTAAFKQPKRRPHKERQSQISQEITIEFSDDDEESVEEDIKQEVEPIIETPEVEGDEADRVTFDELNLYIKDVYDALLKKAREVDKSCISCDVTYKKLIFLDKKLEGSLKLGNRFDTLDVAVEEYADKVNALDRKLGTQMTEYQDALTQMQYDLEAALDTLAEVLAAPSGAIEAIAELNLHMTAFQRELSNAALAQAELKKEHRDQAVDLTELREKIEELQEVKITRDEVVEALSDKAGIAELNGMVTAQQFDAVSGDFEKRIGISYEQFNNKEIVWQKSIDDLIRAMNEKADYIQMVNLNNQIQKYIDKLRGSLEEMLAIVGELDENPIKKKLERFGNCLSCGKRFHTDTVEDQGYFLEDVKDVVWSDGLSRPPVVGAESSDVKEDSVPKICIPGQAVPHPVDPRSSICQRYCGASVVSHSDRQSSLKVPTTEIKPPSTTVGSDGKVYMTDVRKKPCAPCIIKKLSPQISKASSMAFTGPVSVKELATASTREMILSEVGDLIHEKEIKSSLYQPISTKQLVFAPMDTIHSESEALEDEK